MIMKDRSQIEEKYKWDLSALCKSDDCVDEAIKKFSQYIDKFKAFKGKLNSKENIWKYLTMSKKFQEELSKAFLYADLVLASNLDDEKAKVWERKLQDVDAKFSYETSFITNELNDLSDQFLDDLIKDKKFKDYNRSFENIKKKKKHVLSPAEEKLIAGMDFLGGYSDNHRNLEDLDIKFEPACDSKGKKHKFDNSTYLIYSRSKDRTLRKNTFLNMYNAFGGVINTLSSNYENFVRQDCYFAKIRNFSSAFEGSLEIEEVSKEVYDTLIRQVKKNKNIVAQFFALKQKALKLKDFYFYDVAAPIGKADDKKYTYDEAIELVKKAVKLLGEEYVSLIQKAKEERWIDVFPNKGKRSGAFETAIYDAHPYVLTNFTGDIDSCLTLAHELGHAMHSYFTNRTQPRAKSGYSIFLAEIASTTNEILLINYLLSQAKSEEEKISLYNRLFMEVYSTIFVQTIFSSFEETIHRDIESSIPVTKDVLCKTFYDSYKEITGGVKLPKQLQFGWARIPHFYTPFYVFKYATGMICALSFANRILSGEKGALEDYLKFLSAGDSLPPLEVLKNSGCDLEKEQTFESAFDYLRKMLEKWQNN